MIASGSKHVSSIDANKNSHPEEIYGINNGSFDEAISIISLYGKFYAQSHASEAESAMISGSMPPNTIITHLSQHGCEDLTSELDPRSISKGVISTGGSGDVYRGALFDGRRVGIKCLRVLIGMDKEGEKQVKRAARELYIWSKCKHLNIQELIGMALHDGRVAMISPWMKNGNLSWYISRNPEVDRYNLIVQTAAAVAYLKENGVVHGDIKAQNFLVSEDHIVKLTDFGNSIVGLCSLRFTDSTSVSNVTLRWTAPEILLGETRHTFEGDVYALGMTILEIITGSVPWDGVLDVTVIHNLNQKLHPPRPETSMPVGYQPSDRIWELITKCWASESKQRPYATKVREELQDIMKQRQSTCSTHVNTQRTSDNVQVPNEPISSSTLVYEQLQTSSPAQNSRKGWFRKRLSSMMFGLATAESVPNASKAETVEKINTKLQRKLEILERRRHQAERARERSRVVLAKRELILLAGDCDPGYSMHPLAMSRPPARSIKTANTAITSKTDPGPRRAPQGGIFNEAGASPMSLPATLSARSPRARARSLTSFGQLMPESCTQTETGDKSVL